VLRGGETYVAAAASARGGCADGGCSSEVSAVAVNALRTGGGYRKVADTEFVPHAGGEPDRFTCHGLMTVWREMSKVVFWSWVGDCRRR
jgi:hypothetical protein